MILEFIANFLLILFQPYLCWICGSRFRSKNTFTTHQTVHWTGTNFPCKLCDGKFKNPNCLDSHRRKVHGPKTTKVEKVKPLAEPIKAIKVSAPVIKQESLPNYVKSNIYVNIRTYSKYNKINNAYNIKFIFMKVEGNRIPLNGNIIHDGCITTRIFARKKI